MKILNSVFLWFTVSCYFVENVCSTTSHFQEDLIDEAVNAISSISSGTADVLMSLKNIGLKTGLFMKVIVPVGSLIISEINPDAKSEVYKELMKLKEKTDAIWMSNQKAINTTAKELGAKIVEENYINKVIYSAKLLKLFTDKFADPSKYKNEEFISNFKSSCVFGEKSPEGILKYLHLRLVEFCNSTLIPIEVQEYVKNREDLLSIILQFKVAGNEKLPDIEHYLQGRLITL